MRIGNIFMNWLLRSPLHGLLSNNFMLITVKGRKSGQAYTLPVAYALADGQIIVLVGSADKKTWWRNLIGGAEVEMTIAGQTLKGEAQVVRKGQVIQGLLPALEAYCRKYPATARSRGVFSSEQGGLKPSQLMQAARSETIVLIDL